MRHTAAFDYPRYVNELYPTKRQSAVFDLDINPRPFQWEYFANNIFSWQGPKSAKLKNTAL